MKLVFQSEAHECGLACLAMVGQHFGLDWDLDAVRAKLGDTPRGSTFARLLAQAATLGLAGRAVRLSLTEVSQLRLPAILHWDAQHFVVMGKISSKHADIFDPALGRYRLTVEQLSEHFTGFAIEFSRLPGVVEQRGADTSNLLNAFGRMTGMLPTVARILVLGCVLELMGLAAPLLFQLVIDGSGALSNDSAIIRVGAAFLTLSGLRAFIHYARSKATTFLASELQFGWSTNIFARVFRLPIPFFERRDLADIASRFASIRAIQELLTTNLVDGIIDGVLSILTVSMMVWYSPLLAVLALALVALYLCGHVLLFPTVHDAQQALLVASAREQGNFLETIRGIMTIRLLDLGALREMSWKRLFADETNRSAAISNLHAIYSSGNLLLQATREVVVLCVGAWLVSRGRLTFGMLVAFVAYTASFGARAASFVERLTALRLIHTHFLRLKDIASAAIEPAALFAETPSRIRTKPLVGALLEFNGVSFRHETTAAPLLRDVSLEIHRGECVAIVGPSGGGKTTLLKLILGLYRPQSGVIFYKSSPLDDFEIRILRAVTSAVLQDDVLFRGTIFDNICFFDPEASPEWVTECAITAQVHDDIEAMPMKYQSTVGDMGSTLSGGQKQRIFLARALYRRPELLVMDEATSHLDVDLERKVSATIGSLGITRVIVAHRPETIKSADRVLQLRDGHLWEELPNDLAVV